jgi:hypothetical protein
VHLEVRFVVLAQRGACEESNCRRDPRSAHLHVVKRLETGLAVADNLTVRCDVHLH